MSIETRLEKIRHIAQELELCLAIVEALPGDHLRRVLARRLVVRAKDFVEHCRQLRRPLVAAGFSVTDFHRRKEDYASAFLEYFPLLRDRMGAHLQDVDFLNRLEVWSSVEVVKLSYFVEGAREIYVNALGGMGIPGYQPYARMAEFDDDLFVRQLGAIHNAEMNDDRPRIAVDLVAGSRPQDAVILNESPPHLRSKQIVSLIEWGELAQQLLRLFAPFVNATRIIKSMLITDVVSMADCLVTRSLTPGAAQKMKGLDDLLRESDEDPTDIVAFKTVFRFEEVLTDLRSVRDKIGGHVDVDAATALASLLTSLDQVSTLDVFRFWDKMRSTFNSTCRRVLWLRLYLTHNEPLQGVTSVSRPSEYITPFNDRDPRKSTEVRRLLNDYSEATIEAEIGSWIEEGDSDSRHYLWRALMQSAVVERGCREELTFELRVAHNAALRKLLEGSAEVRQRMLKLLNSCRTGSPNELVEILLRGLQAYHERNDHALDGEIYGVLGLMPCNADEPIVGILRQGFEDDDPKRAADAATALYLFLVRLKSGPVVPNPPQRHAVAPDLCPLIERLPAVDQAIVLLRCASAFTDQTRTVSDDLVEEYATLQRIVCEHTTNLIRGSKAHLIENFVNCHDYVSVAVLCADSLGPPGHSADASELLNAVAAGRIRITHQQDMRATAKANHALALLRLGRFHEARTAAEETTRAYPNDVHLKLTCIGILLEAGGDRDACSEMLAYVRRSYRLGADDEHLADALENAIAKAPSPEAG